MGRYDIAKEAYQELVKAQTILRSHRKIMIALPKNKLKRYQNLLAKANMMVFNAEDTWRHAIKNLEPDEVGALYKEVHV